MGWGFATGSIAPGGLEVTPRARPRFAVDVKCSVEGVMQTIRDRLGEENGVVARNISKRHVVLVTDTDPRKMWYPQLSLTVDAAEEGAQVRAQFSPHPHIWTAFIFTYGVLFVLGLAGVMYGVAQLALDRTPWALITPVVNALIAGFVYGAAFIGQGLAGVELWKLGRFLEESLDEAVVRERLAPRTPRDSALL